MERAERAAVKLQGLHISTQTREPGMAEISCAGELDLATSALLREAVDISCEREDMRALIIDLREVTFIDSTGLRALWHARERSQAAGCELALRAPSEAVRYLLKLTKLERAFAVVDG